MADEPISGLTETTSVTGNEFLPIVQGGVTKKIKQSNLVPNQLSFSTTVLFDSNITMVAGVIYLEKNTNASNRSLTIPSATGNTGKFIFVAKQYNNGYTITCSGVGISSTLTRSNDSVLYVCDGTSWQPHLNISNELLLSLTTKEPTITAGTTSQYWRGDKTWQTFPSISTPNLDEVTDVGNTTTNSIEVGGLVVDMPSGSGVAAKITKGGNGEALTVHKTSGSGNVASFTGGTTLISQLDLTTPLADSEIASASTWNGKFNTPTGLTTNTVSRWNGTGYENSYIQELTGTVGGNSIGATRPYPLVTASPGSTNAAWSGYLKWVDNGVNLGELFIYKP